MKIQLIGLVLLFALFSCKKNDIENNDIQTSEIENSKSTQVAGWTTIQNWSASGNSFQSVINDKNITASVISEGLVLLFVKTANGTRTLPSQVDHTNYYYQVEDGSLSISAMVNAGTDLEKEHQFSYIIFSKEQLQKLEEKGYSKSKLVQMAYEPVKQLNN
jgi:hypothetical protein